MLSTIVVIGLRTCQCEGYQLTIPPDILQVEVLVGGNGICYLTPRCDNRLLSFLTTGGQKQQKSEKLNIYAISAQFRSILGAKVIIFLQISTKICNFAH